MPSQAVSEMTPQGPAGPASIRAMESGSYAPGELIVKFKPGVGQDLVGGIAARLGGSVKKQLLMADYWLLSVPETSDLTEAVTILSHEPSVERAELNRNRNAHFIPDDPLYRYQWHLPQIQMPQAWDLSRGRGVIVAILDTGIAFEDRGNYKQASDLVNTHFVKGWDFVNNDAYPNDDHGHGTHIAGTIAQSTGNGQGVAGIAYEASIMPVKVLDFTGSGWDTIVSDGMKWAVDNGAKVINLSLGGGFPSGILEETINYAYSKGVVVVASSGNSAGPVEYPAAYDKAIAVGAIRYDALYSYYSNFGTPLDIVAPGGDLRVDQNADGNPDGVLQQTFAPRTPAKFDYLPLQGTSMATAHVSGVAALLISAGVATDPDAIRQSLQWTARDLGPVGWDQHYGYGLIQAYDALRHRVIPTPNPATASFIYLPITMRNCSGGW